MDERAVEDRWLKDNKLLGQLVGVWPNQNRFVKYFARFVIFVVINLTNMAQISRVVMFFSLDTLTDQMPFLVLGFGILIKQYNYVLNEDKLKELLDGIVSDWLIERPKEELDILEMYSKKARALSSFYKISILSSLIMFLLLPTIPPIMDFVVPLNTSRERILIYPSYYFVDEQEYYYPILAHTVLSAIILGCVYVACDLNLVHVVQHACALLAISGYRLKHAMDDVDLYSDTCNDVSVDKAYAKVVRSIHAHKRANEYVRKVDACHVHYFFIAVACVVMVFTVTFIKVTTMELGSRYLTFCMFIVGQLVHVLFLTIMGQFAIDSNEEVFQKICEARWYHGTTKTQTLYLLVLRKCLSPTKLTGGGLIVLNLDSFLQILKASFSYYTVLKSS
ncbi:unnamed protein product [Xylocopa violacea]|uniref:Odorant receptor n=1 Tax=Xylocopa violacea TaxID=135666 RepID=A0ABP1PIP9_XYLVO